MEEEIWDGLVKLERRSVGRGGEQDTAARYSMMRKQRGDSGELRVSLDNSGGLNIEILPHLNWISHSDPKRCLMGRYSKDIPYVKGALHLLLIFTLYRIKWTF